MWVTYKKTSVDPCCKRSVSILVRDNPALKCWNVQQEHMFVSDWNTGWCWQTQWLCRVFRKRAAVSVVQHPSRPPTRREGLRNAFYRVACLVTPSSSDLPYVSVSVSYITWKRGMRVCAWEDRWVSVVLFAWIWIFHVHCYHCCRGFQWVVPFFSKIHLADSFHGMTAQERLFFLLQLELKWFDEWTHRKLCYLLWLQREVCKIWQKCLRWWLLR